MLAVIELDKGDLKFQVPHGDTPDATRNRSLLAGMNIKLLAENMGTSVRMLELHYAKFIAASRRELVEKSTFRLGLKPSNNVTAL